MAISKKARYYQNKIKVEQLEKIRLDRIKDCSFTIGDIKATPYNNKYTVICFRDDLLKVVPVVEGSYLRLYIEDGKGNKDADNMLFNQYKQQKEITQRINQLYEFYYLKLYGPNYKHASK